MSEKNERMFKALFCPLSEVQDMEKLYLYRPWIPLGKITIFSADPGTGKTKLALAIAAGTTRGLPTLGTPCGKAGNVLMFSAEDDASDVKKTVVACGGDAEKVFVLSEKDEALSLLARQRICFNSTVVEWAIQHYNPALVVFDPLQRYIGRTDTNSSTATNEALKPLTILGKKYGCAFLIIAHHNKGSHGSLLYKSSGSQDIAGNARSMLSIVRDPVNPSECIAIHVKSNNVRGKSIRYAIRSIAGDEDFAAVDWLGLEDYTESDYWKSLKRRDEKEFASQIDETDPVVQTILHLVENNPAGVRVRKQDFWTAAEMHTGAALTDGIDGLVKRYRRYLWENHSIFVDAKSSQSLKPFRVDSLMVNPSKSPDRCLA
ncbi:MAG: AAA family ATPase, partial [Lachnospiraceae bacterium]|nr:AAA family ATPase [Lachnospiraceae bacterium]